MVHECDGETSEANLVAEEKLGRKFGFVWAKVTSPLSGGILTFEVAGKTIQAKWGDRDQVLETCPTEIQPEKASAAAPEVGRLFLNKKFPLPPGVALTEPKRPIYAAVSEGRWMKVQMQLLRGTFVVLDAPGRPSVELDLGDASLIDWASCRLGRFGGPGFELYLNAGHTSLGSVPDALDAKVLAAVAVLSARPQSDPDAVAAAQVVVASALQLLVLDPRSFTTGTRQALLRVRL